MIYVVKKCTKTRCAYWEKRIRKCAFTGRPSHQQRQEIWDLFWELFIIRHGYSLKICFYSSYANSGAKSALSGDRE